MTNFRGWYYLSGSTFLSGINDTQWEACATLVSVHMMYVLYGVCTCRTGTNLLSFGELSFGVITSAVESVFFIGGTKSLGRTNLRGNTVVVVSGP